MTSTTHFGTVPDARADLESLDDGREIPFDRERVGNVAEHPACRNAAQSIGRLYDAIHAPDLRECLHTVDRSGVDTHRFFAPGTCDEPPGRLRR